MTAAALNVPPELVALPQWVMWRSVEGRKRPYMPNGIPASSTNAATWGTFESCLSALERHPQRWAGVGFVFTSEDDFVGVDLDDALDAGELKPWATPIIEAFSDTYSEISPSGTGMKIWCRGRLESARKFPLGDGGVEVYDTARYFTVTGQRWRGAPVVVADHCDTLPWLLSLAPGTRSVPFNLAGPIPYGQRHHRLVSIGGTLAKRGCTPLELAALFVAMRERFTGPPVSDDNLIDLAHDLVARYGGHP